MKGLTEKERLALTVDETYPDDVIDGLVERGLLRLDCCVCCTCGDRNDCCNCDGDEQEAFESTELGKLALRLDAAAKAIAGVAA